MSSLKLNTSDQNALWAVGFILSIIPAIFLRGLTISYLWGWFLVPIGLPAIGLALALGLGLTILFLTNVPKIPKLGAEPLPENFKAQTTNLIMRPIIVLILGFIFHLFV